MSNLKHHFPTYYIYSTVKAYRELNLVRALDEDTTVFSLFFCSTGPDSCLFLGMPPFISDTGSLRS